MLPIGAEATSSGLSIANVTMAAMLTKAALPSVVLKKLRVYMARGPFFNDALLHVFVVSNLLPLIQQSLCQNRNIIIYQLFMRLSQNL